MTRITESPGGRPPVRHMVQLDGLRAVAILLVMVGHFYWPLVPLRLGLLGVRLFFVLSGYLITGILLECRDALRSPDGRWFAARQFYIRRFLRIFPAYYAALVAATLLLRSPTTREGLWWHATYTSNVYFSWLGHWLRDGDHFWSLATEEQFYLVWPWFVLGMTQRLPLFVAGAILMSPVFRAWRVVRGDIIGAYVLLPSCLDSLGLGALLALFQHEERFAEAHERLRVWALRLGAPLAFAFVLMDPVYCWLRNPHLQDEWAPATRAYWLVGGISAVSLFFVWLIDGASRGFANLGGRLLASRPMTYIGRISYGVYLVHPYAYRILELLPYPLSGLTRPGFVVWNSAVRMSVSIAVAAVSWTFFERPLNGLKKYFAYAPPVEGSTTGVPAHDLDVGSYNRTKP